MKVDNKSDAISSQPGKVLTLFYFILVEIKLHKIPEISDHSQKKKPFAENIIHMKAGAKTFFLNEQK